MSFVIKAERSIIPACDVSTLEDFRKLVRATHDVEGISAYKVGFDLGLGHGLPAVVGVVREFTDLPVIYDHQKAGTDIPDTGKNFARRMKTSGVNAAILFPQAGPATEEEWIKALQAAGVGVIVGGEMTHPEYLEPEGGYIAETAPQQMYRIATRKGVRSFVVPGNKPEKVAGYRALLEEACDGQVELMAPGFVKQKGKIEDTAKAAGDRWHAIVGSGIYAPGGAKDPSKVAEEDIHTAAKELCETIRGA
ncbi:MAG: hypothetical protein HYS81_00965 [Candidatus Aenigmatarchaeota archaeon]|nr:MAG: hypothetical protein HYS81_00965 [Candidatus Aenigmarchaeota archaeon]